MANVPVIKFPLGVNSDGSLKSVTALVDSVTGDLPLGQPIGQGGSIDLGGGVGCFMDTINIPYKKDYLIFVYNAVENADLLATDGFSELVDSLSVTLLAHGEVSDGGNVNANQVDPCTLEPLEADLFTTVAYVKGHFAIIKPSDFVTNDANGWAVKFAYPDWLVTLGKPDDENILPHIFAIDMTDSIQGGC